MKSWDILVIGGGIIGLSVALELRRSGAEVAVIERDQPGHEASWAAGGMLGYCDPQLDARLAQLGAASARMYPEWIREIEAESGHRTDFHTEGTILLLRPGERPHGDGERLTAQQVRELEPLFEGPAPNAYFVSEPWVDPRALATAAAEAAKQRGVHLITGIEALEVLVETQRVAGVRTERAEYGAAVVINCAGAWAGQIKAPHAAPTRPAKGHMLAVVHVEPSGGPQPPLIRHVIRHPASVYLIPRGDGRIVIGSTLEPAGFDKTVLPNVIKRLHQQAANLVPAVFRARMVESWAGLRPGTPDNLPILGATPTKGYFIAAGHYRDGILLAPITGVVMSRLVAGVDSAFDLREFSPERFAVAQKVTW